jgi:hypothetical protein
MHKNKKGGTSTPDTTKLALTLCLAVGHHAVWMVDIPRLVPRARAVDNAILAQCKLVIQTRVLRKGSRVLLVISGLKRSAADKKKGLKGGSLVSWELRVEQFSRVF